MTKLGNKIEDKSARICIVGLGYVGLPLAIAFASKGFQVVGFDNDANKKYMLEANESYLSHIKPDAFKKLIPRKFKPTFNFNDCVDCDVFIVCVPTPLTKNRDPDLRHVIEVCAHLSMVDLYDKLFILESTTYPGTTRKVFAPLINDNSKYVLGHDYFVATSPERQDPGNENFHTHNIPKVVGGLTTQCEKIAVLLYEQVMDEVVAVSNADTAEMVKIFENVYRAVNIALVNELKMLCTRLNIDVWDVIEAAATKPFGFQPFKPGPGLGGHCIPIDPFYLTWKAREVDMTTRFIELAGEINTHMPYYVVDRTQKLLNFAKKSIYDSKILIIGAAYKANVNDMRESPALKIIKILLQSGAIVSYHDPYIGNLEVERVEFESVSLNRATLKDADLVIIVTDHKCISWDVVARYSNLVVDCRNVKEVKNKINAPRYISA